MAAGLTSKNKPLAFVLMPFAAEFNSIYEDLIFPPLAEVGYEVQRADTVWDRQNIMRTIIRSISTADLIVAELTGANPNVFYELGIAHGLRKPVVLISQGVDGIPFDLRSYNTISYDTHFSEVQKLRTSLKEIATRHREGSISFENPVTDFAPSDVELPSFGVEGTSTLEVERQEQVGQPTTTEEEHSEELGLLDFLDRAETSLLELGTIQEDLTAIANDFAAQLVDRGSEAEMVSQSNVPGSTARMLGIVRGMASEMNSFSDRVDERLPNYHDAWEQFEDNFANVLVQVEIESPEDREAAIDMVSQLEEFRSGMSEALIGLEQISGQFGPLRGLSQTLNVAVRRFERTATSMSEEFSTGESILVRTINLLDQKIPNIVITQPEEEDTIGNPVYVAGSGRALEGLVGIRIADVSGTIIAEGTATGGAAPERRPFETELPFSRSPVQSRGLVIAFSLSSTGSEVDTVQIPVVFAADAQTSGN